MLTHATRYFPLLFLLLAADGIFAQRFEADWAAELDYLVTAVSPVAGYSGNGQRVALTYGRPLGQRLSAWGGVGYRQIGSYDIGYSQRFESILPTGYIITFEQVSLTDFYYLDCSAGVAYRLASENKRDWKITASMRLSRLIGTKGNRTRSRSYDEFFIMDSKQVIDWAATRDLPFTRGEDLREFSRSFDVGIAVGLQYELIEGLDASIGLERSFLSLAGRTTSLVDPRKFAALRLGLIIHLF